MRSRTRSTRLRRSNPLESPVSCVRRGGPRAQRVLRSRHVAHAPAARAGREHRQSLDRGRGEDAIPDSAGRVAQAAQRLFDVLSRGYRRETKGVALVDPAGTARQFGDEPLLIARKLGVPVVVGEDRYAAGRLRRAELRSATAFARRRISASPAGARLRYRDAHPDRRARFAAARGRLREPLSSLARADAVVLSGNLPAESIPEFVKRRWRVQRSIFAPPIKDACVAFCGIARPEPFFSQLQQAGLNIVATQRFRDHHAYDARRHSEAASVAEPEPRLGICHDREGRSEPGRTVARLGNCARRAVAHGVGGCRRGGERDSRAGEFATRVRELRFANAIEIVRSDERTSRSFDSSLRSSTQDDTVRKDHQ